MSHVRIDSMVWVKRSELSEQALQNLRGALTVQPRVVSDFGDGVPDPIPMYREDGEWFGIPRGFYEQKRTTLRDEQIDCTDGHDIAQLPTLYRAEGPFVEQERGIAAILGQFRADTWGGLILQAGCGWGKGLQDDEPVLTDRGEVRIADLKVGDMAAGTDGSFYPVIGVYPQGERDLFRVTFTDGTAVVCDDQHLWTVEQDGYQFTEGVVKLMGRTGSPLHLPTIMPLKICAEWPVEFALVDPYTVGQIAAQSDDLPWQFRFVSTRNRFRVLAGVMMLSVDDGGMSCFRTASLDMARSVQWLASSLGAVALLYRRDEKFVVAMPMGFWERDADALTGRRSFSSIEPIGRGRSTCISVGSPDRLFLTRNCVPTHNTATSVEMARRLGRSTVVLVHQEFFLRQWEQAILRICPTARIGIVQQGRCEFGPQYDFTIAMLQSLAADQGRYPAALYRSFGLVISDEVHRTGAASWAGIICRFHARYRLGLSATPRRKDGAENVFLYHIGKVGFVGVADSMVPQIMRVDSAAVAPVVVRGGQVLVEQAIPSSTMTSHLADDAARTRLIAEYVGRAVRKGRKVMVVSERLEHLWDIRNDVLSVTKNDQMVSIDAYTGEWFGPEGPLPAKKDKRLGKRKRQEADLVRAERAQVVLATVQMVSEGLDIASIDVLVLATPRGDVEQTVGRARRWCKPEPRKCQHLCDWRAGTCEGKPKPVVIDIVDPKTEMGRGRWAQRRRFYVSIGAIARDGGGLVHEQVV